AIAARELLEQCAQALAELEPGTAQDALAAALTDLSRRVRAPLDEHATRWAALLDSQLEHDNEE
ncbi:MAG: hypothetical protein WAU52_03370, partial [Burkholderiales bacterium]